MIPCSVQEMCCAFCQSITLRTTWNTHTYTGSAEPRSISCCVLRCLVFFFRILAARKIHVAKPRVVNNRKPNPTKPPEREVYVTTRARSAFECASTNNTLCTNTSKGCNFLHLLACCILQSCVVCCVRVACACVYVGLITRRLDVVAVLHGFGESTNCVCSCVVCETILFAVTSLAVVATQHPRHACDVAGVH